MHPVLDGTVTAHDFSVQLPLTPESKAVRNEITSPLPRNFEKSVNAVEISQPTKIYKLIHDKKWNEIIEKVRSSQDKKFKKEVSVWIIERNAEKKVISRFLAIHQICENYPTEESLKAIIFAYPRGLQMKNSSGCIPLHLACSGRANAAIITILLKYYPEGAQIKDNDGRLPMHLAARQWAEIESVQGLLLAYNRGAKCADSHGLLPIHWACAQNASLKIVQTLLKAFPNCADVKDRWGRTPLDLAKMSENPEKDEIVAQFRNPNLVECDGQKAGESNKDESDFEESYGRYVHSLEKKLMEVSATSSEATRAFRELRDSLTAENLNLKNRVARLNTKTDEQDKQVLSLMDESTFLKVRLDDLKRRRQMFIKCLENMHLKRNLITDVSNKWGQDLSTAASCLR